MSRAVAPALPDARPTTNRPAQSRLPQHRNADSASVRTKNEWQPRI